MELNNFFRAQDSAAIDRMLAKTFGGSPYAAKADSITTSSGAAFSSLESLVRIMYPLATPFLDVCPRMTHPNPGLALLWKQMTALPTIISPGTSEGNRNQRMQLSLVNRTGVFKTLGGDADTTFEAEEASQGLSPDARALATTTTYNMNRINEENVILFGVGSNGSATGVTLGTPGTPVLAAGVPAGTVPAATYQLYVVALTYEGYINASVAGGINTTVSRTNADGSSDTLGGGSSNVSAASNSITLGSNGSLSATWAAVPGAVAYAVYFGTSKAASALAAIVLVNKVTVTAPPAGTQFAAAITADNSVNALLFDGLYAQICNPSSGAYVKSLDGAAFTSDGAGGISEFDAAFASMFNLYQMGPTDIWMNPYDHIAASKLIIANGGAPLLRLVADAGGNGPVHLNPLVSQVLNQYTGQMVNLRSHPRFPKGLILGTATMLPYATPNVPTPFTVVTRVRDWYEVDFALTSRRHDFGQYVSELFRLNAPFSCFAILNAGN